MDELSSAEERLAFLEAVAEESGFDALQLASRLDNASEDKLLAFRKLVESYGSSSGEKEGFRKLELEELIERLYVFSHSLQGTDWTAKLLAPVPRELIRQRIEKEILSHELLTALGNLGLIRDPSAREKLSLWLRQRPWIRESLLSVGWNALTMYQFHAPSYLPVRPVFTGSKAISKELREQVMRDGFEASYSALQQHFGAGPALDFALIAANRVMSTAALGVLSYMLYENFPVVRMLFMLATVDKADLAKYARERNPDDIRREQLESWRRAFHDFEGRYPDPNNPQDQREMERVWKRLVDTPDEDLRVKYK